MVTMDSVVWGVVHGVDVYNGQVATVAIFPYNMLIYIIVIFHPLDCGVLASSLSTHSIAPNG